MGRYRLTPAAKADLAEIRDYIRGRGSSDAATRVGHELREALRKLADMPGMGHVRDDLADETLRVWSVYHYLIIYRHDSRPLEIVRVISGYRDLAEQDI